MELILVRHGETLENKKGVVQGHSPGILTKKGRAQAVRTGKWLKYKNIDVVYSSDLRRASSCTRLILNELLTKSPVYYSSLLRERNFRDLVGKTYEIAKEMIKLGVEIESDEEITERVKKFIDRSILSTSYSSILIVSHAFLLKSLIKELAHVSIGNLVLRNSSVSILELEKPDGNKNNLPLAKVKLLDFVGHLRGEEYIDWYEHYKKKGIKEIYVSNFEEIFRVEKPYVDFVSKYASVNAKILECGCGLARAAMSIASLGHKVDAIDINYKILEWAEKNASYLGLKNINFRLLDFFELTSYFNKNSYDIITHQGVLEHFAVDEIRNILKMQLEIAPLVIFSVPILSKENKKYFSDSLPRNLYSHDFWLSRILEDFKILEYKIEKQRSTNLFVVLSEL